MSRQSTFRFPPGNFRHYFTLFPKFFSKFAHATCSLSVSRLYLAFEGDLPPLIGAAVPSNPTRSRTTLKDDLTKADGAITLSGTPFKET